MYKPNGFDLVVTNDLIPFLMSYFSRFGAWEVKLLVSSYYKSSNINGFSIAEHRLFITKGGENICN